MRDRSHLKIGRALIGVVLAFALPSTASALTTVKDYAVAIEAGYDVTALFSAGDTVPLTSDPTEMFQMLGIPDGLGAHPNPDGTTTVYMNHELPQPTLSRPVLGQPRNRGAFVSSLTLDSHGNVVSGERAYDRVYQDNVLVGPAADEANTTPGFARFCSGSLVGPEEGFDRYIYLTNEEEDTSATFDGNGGQTVAVTDGAAYALSRLGHFSKENDLAQPRDDELTVILSLEDGPSTPDSQLYMYVGTREPTGSVLSRNGLNNGQLYVFASDDATRNTEATFRTGTITGHWVRIKQVKHLDAAQLEAAADAAGAMSFVRIEDGAFSKTDADDFFFDTTGSSHSTNGISPDNKLGRIYHLRLSEDPVGTASLTVVVNADDVIANGGDTAISPDNMDTSATYLMVQEDGTSESRPVMVAKGRDGSIWRYDLTDDASGTTADGASATRVVELDPPGRDGITVGPGVWETSGIIDASAMFGPGTWLFDVQAHRPTLTPAPGTVEDGQLLLLTS